MARKPEVASRTSVPDSRRTTQEPSFCKNRLAAEKCRNVATCRSPMTICAVPVEDRPHQGRDVAGVVLVVGVGVDDDVGAAFETAAGSRC